VELRVDFKREEWWLWAISLVLIGAALAGWRLGYPAVMALSAVQVAWFARSTGSLLSFPSQVRLVYFGLTLLGLLEPLRFWVFGVLAVGTLMVTLFDRCFIALVLKEMPWNPAEALRCDLPSPRIPSPHAGAMTRSHTQPCSGAGGPSPHRSLASGSGEAGRRQGIP